MQQANLRLSPRKPTNRSMKNHKDHKDQITIITRKRDFMTIIVIITVITESMIIETEGTGTIGGKNSQDSTSKSRDKSVI